MGNLRVLSGRDVCTILERHGFQQEKCRAVDAGLGPGAPAPQERQGHRPRSRTGEQSVGHLLGMEEAGIRDGQDEGQQDGEDSWAAAT